MPATQPVATADIPPPVLSQDQLRQMPGVKVDPVSSDSTNTTSAEKSTTPNTARSTPAVRPVLAYPGDPIPGLVEQGNIDLANRPIVKNADGSYSTVRSMSFNEDGKEILIPTVSADGSRILSAQEAIEQYHRTGQFLGKFETPADATAYGQNLHNSQAQAYGGKTQTNGNNTGGQDVIGQLYQDIVGRERSGAAAISPKGAIGVGQIMPSTAAQYGVSREALFDPKINEQVSKRIISDLWNKYHDADAVRVAYNAGPGWADRWLANGRNSSILPHETQNYLAMSSTGSAGVPYAGEMQTAAEAVRANLFGASDRARKQADTLISKIGDFEKDLPAALQRIHEARSHADEAIAKATEAINYQPKPPLIDGFANLGSLGAIIGMMGGLLTKSPMIASLNAGAAAIEAANRGDMAQYERAYDSWKTNSDMLFKIVDLQQKRAQEIMGDEKFMTEEKRVGLDLYLRAIGQEQLADKLRIEGDQFAYDHFKTMDSVVEKYDENRIRLQENHEQHLATQETQRIRIQETIENDRMRNELGRDRNDISRDRVNQTGELGTERNQIARDRVDQTGKLGTERNQIARDRVTQTDKLGTERNQIARDRVNQTGELGRERNDISRNRLDFAKEKDQAFLHYRAAQEEYRQTHNGQNPSGEDDEQMYREAQRAYPKQPTAAQAWKETRYNEAFTALLQQWQADPENAGKKIRRDEWDAIQDRAAVKAGLLPAGTAKFLTDSKTLVFDQFLKEKGGNATSTEMMSFLQSQHTPRSAQGLMLSKFMQAYPNASPEDVRNWYINTTGMMSAERYFISGKGEQVLRSFNVVADHLEIFRDVAREFAAGHIRLKNELVARFETQIGKAAPNNLQLAKTLLSAEISKAVVGGVGALADRTEIQDRLSRASSWEQIEGVIDTAARFVGGQLHGLEQTWTNAGMDQLSPFETKLSPGARKLFGSVPETQGITYGGHAGAPPASTPTTGAQTWPTPSPAAIKALQIDPSLRQDFEGTFGPENTRKYLGY